MEGHKKMNMAGYRIEIVNMMSADYS